MAGHWRIRWRQGAVRREETNGEWWWGLQRMWPSMCVCGWMGNDLNGLEIRDVGGYSNGTEVVSSKRKILQ